MTDHDHGDDDLRAIWQSADPTSPLAPKEALMHAKQRSAKLTKTIFKRDLREGLAMLFGIGVVIFMSWPAPGWLPWLGVAAQAVAYAFVWQRLRKGRNLDPDPSSPTTQWLEAERRKVDGEIRKLNTVVRWYVFPLALGSILWLASLAASADLPPAGRLGAVGVAIGTGVVLFFFIGLGVHHLNRKAVKKILLPYRRELEALADDEAEAS